MPKILIRSTEIAGQIQDILIVDNIISRIDSHITLKEEETEETDIIDGKDLIAVPGMANLHTHAAMTLFRGYGDDLPLQKWLQDYIWPVEAHMTEEDVYWGVRLACLEMIRTGTTCFLDMYSFPMATAQAVEDSGMRAVVSYTLFDRGSEKRAKEDRENSYKYMKEFEKFSDRVRFSLGPHAIYTVSGPQLTFCKEFSEENDVLVHLHLSETQIEVDESIKLYGCRPALYLDKIDAINKNFVLAHSLHLTDEELDIIELKGASTVHNPASNMKLASGQGFKFEAMKKRNIKVGIGTDGCSSSNNLDMFIAMRLAALLGKVSSMNPTYNKAEDIYRSATSEGYQILRLKGGQLKEGYLADLCLLKRKTPIMLPCHNLTSNLVYSADGSVVDTAIVNGQVLMKNGKIENEEEILDKSSKRAYDLVSKYGVLS